MLVRTKPKKHRIILIRDANISNKKELRGYFKR